MGVVMGVLGEATPGLVFAARSKSSILLVVVLLLASGVAAAGEPKPYFVRQGDREPMSVERLHAAGSSHPAMFLLDGDCWRCPCSACLPTMPPPSSSAAAKILAATFETTSAGLLVGSTSSTSMRGSVMMAAGDQSERGNERGSSAESCSAASAGAPSNRLAMLPCSRCSAQSRIREWVGERSSRSCAGLIWDLCVRGCSWPGAPWGRAGGITEYRYSLRCCRDWQGRRRSAHRHLKSAKRHRR